MGCRRSPTRAAAQSSFTYWTGGDLKTLSDPSGRTWSYGYDTNHRLTSYTDPEGKVWGYRYDTAARLDQITDPRLSKTLIGYDTSDRVTSVTRRVDGTTANDVTTTYVYSAPSAPCATSLAGKAVVTNPRGKSTTYCVDADRQVTKAIDAIGRDVSKTYTPNGDVTNFAQFGGTGAASTTAYSLDQAGNDPTYNLTGGTAGAGERFSLTYGASATDPLAKFRVASYTDTQGTDTSYVYDTRGNLTSVKDDQTSPYNQATLTYNLDGTLATAKDGRSNTTTYTYNTAGELITVTPPATTPLGPGSAFGATHYTYDSLSRVATVTDGRGESQTFTYDKLDRVTRIDYGSFPSDHWVTYSYDGNGALTAQENERGLDLAYGYDKLNRRISDTGPEAGFWNDYSYDKASNLKTVKDQSKLVSYGYDDINRVSSIGAPTDSGSGTETISYAYNDSTNPRTTIATFPSGATERYELDLSGKLTKVVSKDAGGSVLRSRSYGYLYQFNEAQRQGVLVQNVTDENQVKTAYSYKDSISGDNGRLVKAETRDANFGLISQYGYSYDAAGNRTRRQAVKTLAGGQSLGPNSDTIATGRAEAFKTTAHASGSTASLTVYLDATSNASSVKVGLYGDAGGHPGSLLAQATIATPTAGAWNRVTLAASVTQGEDYWVAVLAPSGATGSVKFRSHFSGGPGSESSGSGSLSSLPSSWSTGTVYDDDGPLSAYLTGTSVTTSYAFNAANQLCWSYVGTSSADCGSPPAGATGYSYDGAGQQLTGDLDITYEHLTQTDTIDNGTNSMDLTFLGADQNQLWEANGTHYQDNLLGLGFINPPAAPDQSLVRDPDTGSLVSLTTDGDKRFILHDGQDSTIALLAPDDAIDRSHNYDPDGNHTTTGTGPNADVLWTGGTQLDTGQYHFGARLYNPNNGRWTQPDPLNQSTDLTQANLYTYAGGDPINQSDPSGCSAASNLRACVYNCAAKCDYAAVAECGAKYTNATGFAYCVARNCGRAAVCIAGCLKDFFVDSYVPIFI